MEQLMRFCYKIGLLIALVISVNYSIAQQNGLNNDNLKGKVKKMTSIFYTDDLENGTGVNKDAERVVWFDKKGNDSIVLFKSEYEDFKPRKTSYFYSKEEQLDSIVEFDVNGIKKTIFTYEYDSLARMVKQHEVTCKSESYVDTYYEYNEEGLMVKELVNMADSDVLFYSFSYKYENKNVMEMSSSLSSKSSTFKYNDHNDRIFYENTVGVTLYEYEYDKLKNWVASTEWVLNKGLKDGHPTIERIIEYH